MKLGWPLALTVTETATATETVTEMPTNTGTATSTRTPALTLTRTLTSTRTLTPTVTATLTAGPAISATPTQSFPSGPVTIHYTYDELNRLKSADYSTNQSYVYTYDPVGNRISEQTTVNGLSSTVQYGYDDANRMTGVDGISYTYDANGNLLNDGVNTYAYDAANHLSTVHSPSSTVNYAYNGDGDRLQQTIGSTQINYVMDLNAGLAQVLDDGTNQYIYGDDRIAQVNASTEYFLGDALGSVRQLTSASGAVTLAQSYDPYGVELASSGATTSTFGYTGEQTETTGMVYLRARYYASSVGRFVSRDTWGGDEKQPMSYNRWNYTNGNPVNLTDPSGLTALPPQGCDYANPGSNAQYVESQVHNLSKSYWLDTYTAAGLAVQCWATVLDGTPDHPMLRYDIKTNSWSSNNSWGPAQVSYRQADTPMGGPTSDTLRCYIRIMLDKSFIYRDDWFDPFSCDCSPTKDANSYFKLEPALDPMKWDAAAVLMQRRITHAINQCNNCGDTDLYIFAGMAQNGPGFTGGGVYKLQPKIRQTKDVTMDWDTFYGHGAKKDTSDQLQRFRDAVNAFIARGWTVPYIDATIVMKYINYPHTH